MKDEAGRVPWEAIVGVVGGVTAAVLVQTFITTGHSGKEVVAWIVASVAIFWLTARWGRSRIERNGEHPSSR